MSLQLLQPVRAFVSHLMAATGSVAYYSLQHPQAQHLCAAAYSALRDVVEQTDTLSLLVIEDDVVYQGVPLPCDVHVEQFGRALKSAGVGSIVFQRAVTGEELQELVRFIAAPPASRATPAVTANMSIGTVVLASQEGADVECAESAGGDLESCIFAVFSDLREDVHKRAKVDVAGISRVVDSLLGLCRAMSHPLHALGSLRLRDEYTFVHSSNVCILTLAQAMSLGIDGPLLQEMGVAALLHDVGKLYVPVDILNKAGRLRDDEMELVRQHPLKGATYLLNTPGIPKLAAITAFEHHIKFDKTGYPAVGTDWQTNMCSHMTTIADFFDALRTNRPYRGALEFEKVAAMMRDLSGKDFHPTLVDLFLHMVGGLRGSVDHDTGTRPFLSEQSEPVSYSRVPAPSSPTTQSCHVPA